MKCKRKPRRIKSALEKRMDRYIRKHGGLKKWQKEMQEKVARHKDAISQIE